MPVTDKTSSPYASSRVILDIVSRYRTKGLPTPITPDVLRRAGVTESILPRTMQALQGLDLINEDGTPTQVFEGLRLAPEDNFKDALADWVRSVYADALTFVDPHEATDAQIVDAFRAYKPIAMRDRMVSLFVGLCEAAGLRSSGRTRQRAPRTSGTSPKETGQVGPQQARPSPVQTQTNGGGAQNPTHHPSSQHKGMPPALAGLIADLPRIGADWNQTDKDRFLTAFNAVLDFCFPVKNGEYQDRTGTAE